MYLFYTASKDLSIYQQQPYQNTGIDEVLEISKQYYGGTLDISRALIYFDVTSISQSIYNGDILPSFTASLELKIVEVSEIPAAFSIEAWALSGSWEMGTGTRFDNLTTNGASWYYRNGDDTTTNWYNQMDGVTASFASGVTGSWDGLGGSWYTSSVVSQSFNYTLEDLKLNVTSFVKNWNSGSINNNGFILKYPTNFEKNNGVDYGTLKFFSKETNTIYQPKLVISFEDSGSVTGSIAQITNLIDSASYEVVYRCYSPNLKTSYKKGQKVTIKIDTRELYPIKKLPYNSDDPYTSTFAYQVKYYLPTTSYYSIIDTITKEPIIDFNTNTKIARADYSNIIKLDFSNWSIGRNYTLLVKSLHNDNEEIFEIGSFDIYA